MNILIVNNSKLPVFYYGGTERVIWYLGKTLSRLGHKVSFLVAQGSTCDFAEIIERNPELDVIDQIPAAIDLVHFHFTPKGVEKLQVPYLITIHGNPNPVELLDKNAVFVSENHAIRHNAEAFVHNGLDWDDYGNPQLDNKRSYFHFLGKAAWRVKNVKGAINTTLKLKGERLHVLGGSRLNIKMGFRFTWQPSARFYGMVGGEEKMNQLKHSKGLVFPCSILPVTTVPLPEIVKTSSTGIKKGFSISLAGSSTKESNASINFVTAGTPISEVSPSKALSALPTTIGVSSPGKSYVSSNSLISISTNSCSSASST